MPEEFHFKTLGALGNRRSSFGCQPLNFWTDWMVSYRYGPRHALLSQKRLSSVIGSLYA